MMNATQFGRRSLFGLSAAALGSLALAGCSGGEEAAGGGSVELWSWMASSTPEWTSHLEVVKEKAGLDVNYNGYAATEYNRILTTGLTGNNGPDVPQLRSYGLLQNWIPDLEPLDGRVSGLDSIPDELRGGAMGREDQKSYGVPMASQSIHMFYNKTLFAEAGYTEPPATWDDFLAICDDFLGRDITPISLVGKDAWMLPMWAVLLGAGFYGGRDFEAAVLDGSKKFTDEAYVGSLQLVEDLRQYYPKDVVGVGESDAIALFASGKAAMFPGGSFHLATIRQGAPDIDLGVFAIPVAPGGVGQAPVTPVYADASFGLSKKAKNVEGAVALLEWMTTVDFGQFVVDKLAGFSPVPGVTFSDPVMASMQAATAEASANYFLLTDFRYGSPSGTDLLGNALQQVLLGQVNAAQAADELQQGVDTWFKPVQ